MLGEAALELDVDRVERAEQSDVGGAVHPAEEQMAHDPCLLRLAMKGGRLPPEPCRETVGHAQL
jgi:hypothetical protein